MKFLNLKKKEILLILYISILLFSSLGSINNFYKFTDIESTLSSNVGNDGIFTYTENGLKYFAEFITEEKVELMKKQIRSTDSYKNSKQIINGMGTGAESLAEEELEKMVGEIMILNVIKDPKNPIDSKASYNFSSEIYFPPVRSQGSQGSCTSWASVYYSMGYLEAKDYGWDASSGNNAYLLSPAWSYNKLAYEGSGTNHIETGLLLEEWGAATWATIPYTDTDYNNWGNESAWREAPLHRPLQFNWLSYSGDPTITTIKNLVEGRTPVTFNIDANGYNQGLGDNYIISSAEYSSSTITHAQCIVGFDDSIAEDGDVGAFRVVNSWGDSWADGGFYWLTYETLKEIGVLGDGYIQIGYYDDRIDYHPSLVATWEFSSVPTRMDDIITLGVGPHGSPLNTLNPEYEGHTTAVFPSFMALDISEFQSHYNSNNDVLFYLELGSSNTPGIISSFRIERYVAGILEEITPESPDVPKTTPGYVYGTFMNLDHELSVSLDTPVIPEIDNTYTINATVFNNGENDEINVDLFLYLDDAIVSSITIPSLLVGASETIDFIWTPTEYKTYNFTAYAPPVPDELNIGNNIATELISISFLQNYIMTEDYAYSWIDASGGTELLLSDDGYATIALPFSFTFYDVAYSTIHLGANGYLSFTDSTPSDYSNDPIPSGDLDNYYLIAPFWDDILPPSGGHIYVQSFGTYWVAEWLDIYHINGVLLGSFEVVLYDTGEIVFNYDYLDYTSSGYTCGLNLGVDTLYYNSYQGLNDLTDDLSILFTYESFDHDLGVSLEIPTASEINNPYIINATVTNTGENDEINVDLFLYLDDAIVSSITIPSLLVGASETINYMWTPTEYKTYNFTAYAPPVPDEPNVGNNIATEIILIVDTILFDGMYIEHHLTDYNIGQFNANIIYSSLSVDIFNAQWLFDMALADEWQVDINSREITGSGFFSDYTHTPFWIFTDISLGDAVLISSIWDVDHTFEVQDELIYDLPGFGSIEVWVLQDLGHDNCSAWYEKSTGILINGTFYYEGGYNYVILEFMDTNVEFTYCEPLSLTITTPDSASSWETDTSQSITWTSIGSISDVKIELYENDVFVMEIVASTPNDGEFSWLIPTTLVDSTQYQVKISDVANPTTDDFSDNFEIFTSIIDSITVTNPDSTSSWQTETTQSITWTSTGTISDVKIELYENDVFVMEIVASTPNDGEFSWLIPTTLVDSTQYQVKISDVANPTTDDFSDNFEIFTSIIDSITVTNPDSTSSWQTETTQSITWTSTGTISDVKIELYKGGVFEMEIVATTTNDGTYNWDIPTDLEDGIDYQIKISDVLNPATYDESPNFAMTSVDIPDEIPSYNLYIVIVIMCVVSVILLKKRFKLIK